VRRDRVEAAFAVDFFAAVDFVVARLAVDFFAGVFLAGDFAAAVVFFADLLGADLLERVGAIRTLHRVIWIIRCA
jgi:hypothetical protein